MAGLNDTSKQLDTINQKLEYYKDIIVGLESMNYDILGGMYDETEFSKLINSVRGLVKELETAKKSSDFSAIESTLTNTGASFNSLAENINYVFDTARKNITGTLGILNDLQSDGRLHSIGGDFSDQFEFIRRFDMSKTEKFEGQLAKYKTILEDVAKANELLANQKSLNTFFQTQDNSDLNALLGKDLKSSNRAVEIRNLEQEIKTMTENKDFYTGGTAQGEKDFINEIDRLKSELESLKKAKEEVEEVNGQIFDIQQIKGLIPLFNELNSVLTRLNKNRDMIDFIADPIYSANKSADQLKADAIGYGIIPDLGDTKAKTINNAKELKTEAELLDAIKSKREDINEKIKQANLLGKVLRIKPDTSNYTGEEDLEKIKTTVSEYKALNNIKKEVGKASVEANDNNLMAYGDKIVSAVTNTNNLRNEVLKLKDALAVGNTSMLLNSTINLDSFKDRVKEIERVLTDGLQLHLEDDSALHDLELLKNTVKALEKELGSLNVGNNISKELLKQQKELESIESAYKSVYEFKTNKKTKDEQYIMAKQNIAGLTMEYEKLQKALQFGAIDSADEQSVTRYLKEIGSIIDTNKKKALNLEHVYSNMGAKLPDISYIKPYRDLRVTKSRLNKEREAQIAGTKEAYRENPSRLKDALERVNNDALAKRERILGSINNFYSSIIASAKRDIELQEALGNIKGPEDRIKVYNQHLKNTVQGTEEWAKLVNLINQEKQASTADISKRFVSRENDLSKIDTTTLGKGIDKYLARIEILRNELRKALDAGDSTKAATIWEAYASATDKVIGRNKAVELAQAKAAEQARAQQEAIKSLMEETKNYVSTQEALSGQKMSFSEQAAYYDQQANKMKQLAGESKEYIEILKLKRQAEAKAADEAKRAAEIEKKAQEDAVKAARDRVTNTLGTIKKIADGVNNAVNKIVSIIRNGINLINKVFSTIGKFVGRITTGAKAIISLFGSLSNRVRGTAGNSGKLSGSFNILAGTATELRSKILLLKGAFDTLFNNQMVKKAENLMASVYSLKNIAGSGVTQEVLDWANSMEYAFGISAKELIGDINELTGVLYGLGMTAEDTAVGSENLLMMSRYLAFMGAAGGDTSVVMNKLVSGMKGMTQAIDDLGLSVREAQMDAFLAKLKAQGGEFANIGTSFSSLNEEARVYVRYASLIDQFTSHYNMAGFAGALDTVNGRMQIMRQTAQSLITTLGTGLVKAISKLAIFIVPILKAIESAVSKIFAFFGIDVSMTTDINEGTDAVSGLNDGLDKTKDNLDKIDKKSKKAKGSLQSFDRVNNVTSSSSSKGSGSGSGSDFDYSKLMTSALGDLNKLAEETAQSFADKMQEKMNEAIKNMRDKFLQFAKDITGRANFDLGFDWKSIKKSLKTIWKNIKTLISSWGTFFIEIGLKIADDVNIGKIITKFLEFASAVTDLAVAFSEVLIPVLRNFYDEVLSPIVKLVGEKIVDAFDKAIEKVKAWTKYLQDNKPELIEEWTEKLKHFFNVVTGKESANPEDGAIGTVLEILNKIGKVIKALIPIVSDLASALGIFLKEEFLPWLNEKLGELAKWLSENKDAIVKFLKEIAGFVWDSFKVFVDLISKLVDFCVKHPTAVKVFLEGLVAIKIASWAASSAAGIGQLVFQLQLLSKLGGITKALGGIGTAATATSTELATVGAAGGAAAKKSVLSKVLGKTGSLASVESADGAVLSSYMMGGSGVLGGLAKFGTFMGSGATTAGGVAAAGASSMAGIVGGIAGIGDGIKDLYDASKETNEEIKEQKNWSGGTKIGMVGAGAATGAAIGSVVPGVGTAVGAAVGAGVGGVSAIFKGSDISEWLHDAWDNTLKPFFTETIPENFGKLVDGIGQFFTETIPNTISSIGTGISTFFTETVPGFFSSLWEGIKTFFTETVPQTISNIAGSISTFFTETVPGFFGNLIDGVVQFFTEDVPYALGYIAGSLKTFFTETVPGFFGGLWKDIKTFFTETIPTALETITEKATTFLTETIPGFFKGLWKDIKKLFTETIPTALETISTKATTFLTETIPGFFKGLWKDIKTLFTETIPTALETISTKATTFLTVTIPNFFGGIWKSLRTFFTETIPTALETIETKATTFLTVTIPHFFGSIWKSLRKFFTETIPTAVSTVQTGIKTFFTETIPNKIKSVLDGIGDIFDGAVGWVKSKFSSIGSNFSAGYNSAVKKTSAKSAKKVTSHAVGGSIAGGQLFIANENGGAELVGDITGASGAQVANNGMIIKAMTDGVFTGVYNALAEASNQRSNAGGMATNTKIEINGFGLIDSSTLRELARLLAPYNNSNNTNIADVNFSI